MASFSTETEHVQFHLIDTNDLKGASVGPLSLEAMLAEELPQLLQTLLVGVERVICRLPLDDLSFPSSSAHNPNNDTHERLPVSPNNASATNATATTAQSTSCKNSNADEDPNTEVESGGQRRPIESGLKRRELITKNKMMGTKYALLRAIKSENINLPPSNPLQAEVNAMDALTDDSSGNGLGGGLAFPHIDSDEESSDEATKKNGKLG